nr:EAL domain-containing protein [Nitrospirota bacterium]
MELPKGFSSDVAPQRHQTGREPAAASSEWYGVALPLALILCFVVGLGMGLYALFSLRQAMTQERGATLAGTAADVADRLDSLLFERYVDIRALADHAVLRNGTPDAQSGVLRRYQEVSNDYAWLSLTDAQGRVVAASSETFRGRDMSGEDWFLAVSETERVHLGRAQQAPEAGGRSRIGVTFSAPVSGQDGEFLGVVTGWVALDHLRAVIDEGGNARYGSRDGESLNWLLLDQNGTILSESGDQEWHGQPAINLLDLKVPSVVRAAMGEPGAQGFIEEPHYRRLSPVVTGYARTPSYRSFLGFDWTVLVPRDRAQVYAPIDRLVWALGGVGLLLIVPLTGFGLWASRRLLRDIAQRKLAEQRLDDLAYYDPLTGLPNRRLFMDLLVQALARGRRTDRLVAVLFLDLDRFKLVNDSLGHGVGDILLKTIAHRLSGCVRATDTVSRLGGDEFTLILEDLNGAEDAARIAQKVLDAVAVPVMLEGHEVFVAGSVGIALYPTDHEDRDALIKSADTAMYSAKEEGGVFRFYAADMNTRSFERLKLETGLRHAIQRQEFVLHYQPLVDFQVGTMVGVEALVRWQHPERGMLSPDKFIPLAEETGLIVPLGEWVLRTACAQIKAWQAGGFPHLRVAVNLSRRQFQQKNLVESVARILWETGLDPRSLELELTESLLIQDAEGTIAMLKALHGMGIRLSIDDFGAEYSSLGYLKRLPINTLKIDQSFVRDIATNANDASITRAIITLGHCLNLNVVAEGVETEGQAAFLRAQRCNEMQGYYFSHALAPDSLGQLLASWKPGLVGRAPDSTKGNALTSA